MKSHLMYVDGPAVFKRAVEAQPCAAYPLLIQ